jgi:flagellar hook-associated protein 3 FlgL
LLVNGTQYQISFSGSGSGTTYTITSGTGGVFSPTPMASGSYTEGMSLGLPPGGSPAITVPILGTPANGDQFTVQAAPPQGLFETFQSLAAALTATDTSPGTNARRAQAISNALASLDQNQTRLLDTQAAIGARLQQVQAVQAQNTSLTVRLQTEQSELTQINYPEVITRYQQSLTALQAAQKAFMQLQGMNLFQYL